MSDLPDPPTRKMASIIFCDVKGYSKLTEPQLKRFAQGTMSDISAVLAKQKPFYVNTWGDAIVAAFNDPRKAAHCGLALRDLFLAADWGEAELPQLRLRTAIHSGAVYVGMDPILQREGITGTQIALAARLEPVTLPGHVWVTDTFISLLSQEQDLNLAWDDLGERPLAKEWGAARLYRLRRTEESSEIPTIQEDSQERASTPSPLELCLGMLNMGTEEQALAALDVLGQFDQPIAIQTLVEAAKNPNLGVAARKMALLSIGEIKSPTAVADLLEIGRNPEESSKIVSIIAQVLGEIKDVKAVDFLIDLVKKPGFASHEPARKALFALSNFRTAEALATIEQALGSEEINIVRAAIGAAAQSNESRLVPALLKVAQDRERWPDDVRGGAMEGILMVSPNTANAEALRQIALDVTEVLHVREIATLALGLIKNEVARSTLTQLAGRLDDPLSAYALRAIIKPEEIQRSAVESVA
ncbi:HEAT repeat domain-containing protein [Streptomyces sp. NPDC058304]|uniref:HEAT repeat domain-containing protein n=1 Tax=Streptomyces sp. NPDC058304 TaxID=3346437 RepID=UPI0036E97495